MAELQLAGEGGLIFTGGGSLSIMSQFRCKKGDF
jgi:hypothetical protein